MVLGDLGRKKSFAKLDGKLGCCLLPGHGRIFPFLGDITQGQINQFGRASLLGKWPLVLSTFRNCMCRLSMALVM